MKSNEMEIPSDYQVSGCLFYLSEDQFKFYNMTVMIFWQVFPFAKAL